MFKLLIIAILISPSVYSQTQSHFLNLEKEKKNCRQGIVEKSLNQADKSIILAGDHADDLVDSPEKMIYNLPLMEKNNLLSAKVSTVPWSDSYWPLYQGVLGHRYNDPGMNISEWKLSFDYITNNSASNLIKYNKFDSLSPSEKYDYLLGLQNINLTSASWREGEEYFRQFGTVETWMGLCHGWAAASTMMENPVKKVEVKINTKKVTFYPSDIKGLATLLWAKGQFKTRFIGGRCNSKSPNVDDLGRPVEKDCIDNNPGTWHLVIVNQIGLFDRSFIMDATYDYQVWNQPVFSYEYTYYNPKTKKISETLSESVVQVNDWSDDSRKSVRAPLTKSIVGINMRVVYVAENNASIEEFQETKFSAVDYQYDLELDAKNNIIGGEWYSDNHPDFLWIAEKNTFPLTYGDSPSDSIDLNNITNAHKKAAGMNAKYNLPSGVVVKEFFKESAN